MSGVTKIRAVLGRRKQTYIHSVFPCNHTEEVPKHSEKHRLPHFHIMCGEGRRETVLRRKKGGNLG